MIKIYGSTNLQLQKPVYPNKGMPYTPTKIRIQEQNWIVINTIAIDYFPKTDHYEIYIKNQDETHPKMKEFFEQKGDQ